jgi:hypothetical protein
MLNRYPTGAAGGIDAAIRVDAATYSTSVAAGPPAVYTFQVRGANVPANCQFTYTEVAVAGNAPVISVPDTTNC